MPAAGQAAPPPANGEPSWQAGTVPASATRRRRLPVPIGLLVIAGFVIVSGVYSWLNDAGRSSTGEIDRAGQLQVGDLRVGDCFDLANPDAEQVDQVTARPCAEAHGYELVFADTMPAGEYPTDAEFQAYVEQFCNPAFGAYVGLDYNLSSLELSWFYPTSAGWTHGDRKVQCAIFDPQQDQVSGSLRAAAR